MSLLIKYITINYLFYEQLGQTKMWSNIQELIFLDLFLEGKEHLSIGIKLARYITSV